MWQQAQWSVVGATRNWNRSVGIIRWRYCESIRLPYWHTGVQSGLVARPKSAPPTAKASDSAAPLPAASMPRKSMVSESTCTRTYLPDASHFSRGEPLREATERCATRQPQRNCRFGSVGERLPAGARPAQRTGAFRTANPRRQPRSSAACRGSKFPSYPERAHRPPTHKDMGTLVRPRKRCGYATRCLCSIPNVRRRLPAAVQESSLVGKVAKETDHIQWPCAAPHHALIRIGSDASAV